MSRIMLRVLVLGMTFQAGIIYVFYNLGWKIMCFYGEKGGKIT